MLLNNFVLPPHPNLTRDNVANHIRNIHGNKDADTFILFGGIGDPVQWLSVLSSYKQRLNKPLTLVIPKGTDSIPLMYENISYDKIEFREFPIDSNSFFSRNCELKPNELIAHHMHYGDSNFRDYTNISCASGLTNTELIKTLLGLPLNTSLSRPLPLASSILRAAKLFEELNLPAGRTILVAPLANSYPHKIQRFWWEKAVAALKNKGFTVVNNIGANSHFSSEDTKVKVGHIDGATPVDIPIDMAIPFAELCGYFLGIRSGLCDLLAYSNTRKLIVYPEPDPNASNFNWVRSVAHYWSLQRNYNCERTLEYFVGERDTFNIEIINNFIRSHK
jgi:hypothetical protein